MNFNFENPNKIKSQNSLRTLLNFIGESKKRKEFDFFLFKEVFSSLVFGKHLGRSVKLKRLSHWLVLSRAHILSTNQRLNR
jgi:hypothetical protein